jgi:hypothetical protein
MTHLKFLNFKTEKINPSCILCKKGNSCPLHSDSKTKYHQDPEIIACVKDIMNKFINLQELLLLAETQSGKSDVIKRIVELFKEFPEEFKKYFNIDNIFVLICCSDNKLRDQLYNKHLKDYLPRDHVMHLGYMSKITKTIDKITNNPSNEKPTHEQSIIIEITNKMHKRSLIIFDEAHCDMEVRRTVDNLRKLLDISYTCAPKEPSIKILNISATPFVLSNRNMPEVELTNRKDYMFDNNKIFHSYDLINNSNGFKDFMNDVTEELNKKSYQIGYYIIRVNNDKEEKALSRNVASFLTKGTYKIVPYNMDSDFDINEKYLNHAPAFVTFIIIKDMLRQGATITKTHIIAVHDAINNSHTHTTYQGLLGRMTGYDANKKALVFCDIVKAKEQLKWIKSKYKKEFIPNHARYILKNGSVSKNCYGKDL